MTERERFHNCMHYKKVDRVPYWDFGFWAETIERWHKEGLPASLTFDETFWYRWVGRDKDPLERYFGMDKHWRFMGPDLRLIPRFEVQVLAEDETTRTMRGEDGVINQVSKKNDSVPHSIDWTLKGRDSWQEYKRRLNPDDPARTAERLERVRGLKDRNFPLGIFCGSLFGVIRNWMGLVNISLLLYDDPELFGEMVDHIAGLTCRLIEPFLKETRYEYAHFWEDMAFANGPMMSPDHFRKFLVPNYKKITSLLKRHGVDVVMVDCDGKIDDLVPLWLEAGVNCMFPFEIGTWKADPWEMRKKFGRDLLFVGGINKRALAAGKEAIDRELEARAPLIKDGGYIPLCDHRVPPDVSLADYKYYLKRLKELF